MRTQSRSACLRTASRRPYSVLLPVGFTVPPTLPPTRCALTAPFHPYRSERKHAAAVYFLWHCPWVHTRRMLSGTVCPRSPDFPLRQPFGSAGAAVRPTDSNRDGDIELARQVARPNNHVATLRIRVRGAALRSGRERRWSGRGRGWQAVPAMYCVSMGRRCRRRVPAGSGAERQSRPRT
jgi:hypothetical protein